MKENFEDSQGHIGEESVMQRNMMSIWRVLDEPCSSKLAKVGKYETVINVNINDINDFNILTSKEIS